MSVCAQPGCPKLVKKGMCDEHKKAAQRRYDATRGSRHERGYGSLWEKIRRRVLRERPLCEVCEAEGVTKAAEEVHHEDGDSSNNDPKNLTPLCRAHHNEITHGRARG